MKRMLCLAGALSVLPMSASAQSAQPTLTVAQVLEKAHTASGILDGAYRIEERKIEGGVTHSLMTVLSGNDYITTERVGDGTRAWGESEHQPWFEDMSGVAFPGSGFHKVDPIRQAWSNATGNAVPTPAKYVDAAKPYYELTEHASDGSSEIRDYDASSFLCIADARISPDGSRVTHRYADFRRVGSAMRPFRITSDDGDPRNDAVTTVLYFQRIPESAAHIEIPESRIAYLPPANEPQEIPAQFTTRGIIVHLTINGKGADFLLDTGAPRSDIDAGAAHALGLSVADKTVGAIAGTYDVATTLVRDVMVGPLHGTNIYMGIIPFTERYKDEKIVGLLGGEFFGSNVVRIDFPHKKLIVYPLGTFHPESLGVKPTPVQLDDGWIRTTAWVGGVKGSFVLDTGSYGMILTPRYARRCSLGAPTSNDLGAIHWLGGVQHMRMYDAHDIVLGGVEFREGNVDVPTDEQTTWAGYDGIIGRDVLRAYAITLDYANSVIYLSVPQ